MARDVLFRCMHVVEDNALGVIEERADVEEGAVRSNSDRLTIEVLRLVADVVVGFPFREWRNLHSVLAVCLVGDLVYELVRRAQIDDPLLESPPPPLSDPKPDEGLTAAGWKLYRDVGFVLRFSEVITKHIRLVRQDPGDLSSAEVRQERFWALDGATRGLRQLKRHTTRLFLKRSTQARLQPTQREWGKLRGKVGGYTSSHHRRRIYKASKTRK
jgi:hypothetical protein